MDRHALSTHPNTESPARPQVRTASGMRQRLCWHKLLPLMLMGWWVAWGVTLAEGQAEELRLQVQLIWGTDRDKPPDPSYRMLEDRLKKKLARVFKWKHYFEISDQKTTLVPKEVKRLKLRNHSEIEVRCDDPAILEIKLFGEGKWTKTMRQSVKALEQGELAVLAGDAKDSRSDAWFVIVSLNTPP
ncbi:MAG: hypothetical protein FJ387_14555 [Verrucomicrobia bacterium]|nr:hypothetical protein [Verrucomicrobiota bacterium]